MMSELPSHLLNQPYVRSEDDELYYFHSGGRMLFRYRHDPNVPTRRQRRFKRAPARRKSKPLRTQNPNRILAAQVGLKKVERLIARGVENTAPRKTIRRTPLSSAVRSVLRRKGDRRP